MRVPASEQIRRDSAPVENLQCRPVQPNEREIAVLKSAGRGYNPAVQMYEPTDPAQTPEQI
jgi:hypothetical protein